MGLLKNAVVASQPLLTAQVPQQRAEIKPFHWIVVLGLIDVQEGNRLLKAHGVHVTVTDGVAVAASHRVDSHSFTALQKSALSTMSLPALPKGCKPLSVHPGLKPPSAMGNPSLGRSWCYVNQVQADGAAKGAANFVVVLLHDALVQVKFPLGNMTLTTTTRGGKFLTRRAGVSQSGKQFQAVDAIQVTVKMAKGFEAKCCSTVKKFCDKHGVAFGITPMHWPQTSVAAASSTPSSSATDGISATAPAAATKAMKVMKAKVPMQILPPVTTTRAVKAMKITRAMKAMKVIKAMKK
eukprot:TRINITY_DN9480_c0_g1_i1.p1 TRINITY_DN9480_c0_g1~~TRINITY_DN9480_c0_g1_i1.p1  ORF type:complete len:295 (+),score=63.62 TRINITY_DN9480_c0_g1_i1:66-950(+)